MAGHESLIINQARTNQVEHTGRGLGKARQNQLHSRQFVLYCSWIPHMANYSGSTATLIRRGMKRFVTP